MEEFIGMIKLFGGNFAPKDWAFCNGALLPISQYSALYSILGTQFGGDGKTTFALPDLRTRVALGAGQGPGLSPYTVGAKGGSAGVTLIGQELPVHNHGFKVSSANATQTAATSKATIGTPCAGSGRSITTSNGYNMTTPNTNLSAMSIVPVGGNGTHNNMQPYLGLNYIICIYGVYPPRP